MGKQRKPMLREIGTTEFPPPPPITVSRPYLGTSLSPGSLRDLQRSPIAISEPDTNRPLAQIRLTVPGFVKAARRAGTTRRGFF